MFLIPLLQNVTENSKCDNRQSGDTFRNTKSHSATSTYNSCSLHSDEIKVLPGLLQ